MRRCVGTLAAALCSLAACFSPSLEGVACGAFGDCPDGLSCYTGMCLAEPPTEGPNGLPVPTPEVPVPLEGLGQAVALSAGTDFTCAVRSGRVGCIGINTRGQLGLGHTLPLSIPLTLGIDTVLDVDSGDQHSCALIGTGDVYCWGYGLHGRVGDGANAVTPLPMQVASNATEIILGGDHSCANRNGESPLCWGKNLFGQIGDQTTTHQLAPIVVGPSSRIRAIGDNHTCGDVGSDLGCWGNNASSQLGNGDTTNTLLPVEATLPTAGIVDYASFADHSCVAVSNGDVLCWGANGVGQLGNDSTLPTTVPTKVKNFGNASAVTTGAAHGCALRLNQQVVCWGDNTHGQLGDGTYIDSPAPVTVQGLSGVVAIEAGGYHTCALTDADRIYCWGRYQSSPIGFPGSGDSATPTLMQL